MHADTKMLAEVKAFLERQRLEYTESEEQHCIKLEVRRGIQRAFISIFNTGTLLVQGSASQLKALLEEMKQALEAGDVTPGQALPFEIERFPETIQERVPTIEAVIVEFIQEAIVCVKANALLAATFMLGATLDSGVQLMSH